MRKDAPAPAAVSAPEVFALVGRLRRGLLSRNRSFGLFLQPAARRAQRLHRRLRALERDLRAPGAAVRLELGEGAAGTYRLTLDLPHIRLRRIATLAREELELLCEDAVLRARLGAA